MTSRSVWPLAVAVLVWLGFTAACRASGGADVPNGTEYIRFNQYVTWSD